MEATLLVELLTEELPPRSLKKLSETFADTLASEIIKHRLKERDPKKRVFATPRRLAVLIADVRDKATDSSHSVEGPVSSNAKAVEGFAKKHKVTPEALERRQTAKGEIVVANFTMPGVLLDAVLAGIVEEALKKLPVAKMMRWGDGEAQFVRPVHGLLMMHGARVVPGTVLGLPSGNRTRGHRFLGAPEIVLKSADEYAGRLSDEGRVIPDFAARRADIEGQLQAEAKRLGATLGEYADLLDEVTALVELPTVYVGGFDPRFLDVPQECLILTMRQNQKYFPLFGTDGTLLPKFLIVSNMRIPDPRHIIAGNERVVRPRLDDARFFYDQDQRARLETRVPELAKVVYHNKLGTQLERVERLQLLAGEIARRIGADVALAERAAWLAKADLLTGMVGEFPELQGVMGRYYALHDGEPQSVADAIEAHYRPRFAGDRLPEGPISSAVALADKLDALVGMFAVGGAPTGDKDPFGLRRHSLGILRILIENGLPLDLVDLLGAARLHLASSQFGNASKEGAGEFVEKRIISTVHEFVLDRLRGYLRDSGFDAAEVESVVSLSPTRADLVIRKLDAVKAFRRLPEAQSLAAANKRIRNILTKSAPPSGDVFSKSKLVDPAEAALYAAYLSIEEVAEQHFLAGRFTEALTSLAALKVPVDNFFDQVLVNVDDAELRNNRLLLLMHLERALNRVADISRLAA